MRESASVESNQSSRAKRSCNGRRGGGRVGGLSTVWRIEKSPRGEETIKKNGKRCGVLKSRDKSDRRSPLLRPEIGPPGKSKVGRDKGERTKGN